MKYHGNPVTMFLDSFFKRVLLQQLFHKEAVKQNLICRVSPTTIMMQVPKIWSIRTVFGLYLVQNILHLSRLCWIDHRSLKEKNSKLHLLQYILTCKSHSNPKELNIAFININHTLGGSTVYPEEPLCLLLRLWLFSDYFSRTIQFPKPLICLLLDCSPLYLL